MAEVGPSQPSRHSSLRLPGRRIHSEPIPDHAAPDHTNHLYVAGGRALAGKAEIFVREGGLYPDTPNVTVSAHSEIACS